MLLKIHSDNPEERKIMQVVECLRNGGVIICPTDTVYGLGCDIYNTRAMARVARIKGVRLEKANFSFICHDLSHLSEFTRHVDTPVYKVMRKALPGPFTFILPAGSEVPKLFRNRKKTVGIRIPGNNIVREIVRQLGRPIISTSIHDSDEIVEYTTDPEVIYANYRNRVDMVIDGGPGHNTASTVVDCTSGTFTVLRQGMGRLEDFV